MATDAKSPTQPPVALISQRAADFTFRYSNNVQYEPSIWDLKLTFGQTDQTTTPPTVIQHTAITLSWPEVKVLAYFLRSCLAGHEAQIGKIVMVPDTILPIPEEPPQTISPSQRAAWKNVFDAMNKIYDEFMRENPEAVPVSAGKPKRQ